MRVLVCGGRDYKNKTVVYSTLDHVDEQYGIDHLICGGASGADSLAIAWCYDNDIKHEVHYADWGKHGRAAGPIRNQQMLDTNPDLVVAFPGGRGTAHMVKIAKAAGVEVIEVTEASTNDGVG
jgi:hypothetical protein